MFYDIGSRQESMSYLLYHLKMFSDWLKQDLRRKYQMRGAMPSSVRVRRVKGEAEAGGRKKVVIGNLIERDIFRLIQITLTL